MSNTFTVDGLDDAIKSLEQLAGDLPKRALADALNHTANQARIALKASMSSVFQDPTPWTLNSIHIQNAKPSDLTATVWVKDVSGGKNNQSAENYLLPHVDGGERTSRKSENYLRSAGILPLNRYIAPARDMQLDPYGNIPRGTMGKILSGLKAFNTSGSDHNATHSKRSAAKRNAQRFFVMRDKTGQGIGIAERLETGKGIKLLIWFVSEPRYSERFDFYGITRKFVESDGLLEENINIAITKALNGETPSNWERRKK